MSILTIYLNTNSAKFCDWLNDYTKKRGGVNSADYPYMGGAVYRIHYFDVYEVKQVKFSANIRQPAPSNQQPPLDTIQIWSILDPDEGVTYTYWGWDMNDVLSISWLDVEKGLKVTINHEGAKWIIPPVFQLLAAIKTDYPSASDEINRYIIEKADWWGFVPPYSLEAPLAVTYIIAEQAKDEVNKNKTVEPAPRTDKEVEIQTALTYPGGLKNFIAFMNKLFGNADIWQAHDGQKLQIRFGIHTDTEAYWNVETYTPIVNGKAGKPQGQATICAYETQKGLTEIEFKDGINVNRPFRGHTLNNVESNSVSEKVNPIGNIFNQLTLEILERVRETDTESKAPKGKAGAKKSHPPKGKGALRKWAIVWEFYEKHYGSQKLNAMQFLIELDQYDQWDKPKWYPRDAETLQNLLDDGRANKIPKHDSIE